MLPVVIFTACQSVSRSLLIA